MNKYMKYLAESIILCRRLNNTLESKVSKHQTRGAYLKEQYI